MSVLDTQYKEKANFSLPLSPPVRSPPVWPCEGLCGLLWGGAESLCPSRRIQAGFGPLSRRLGGMPIRGTALRGTKRKARKIKSPHLPAVRTAARVRQRQLTGETVLPTFGWGKQSVWLAASGCQTPFAGRSPHPLFCPARPIDNFLITPSVWSGIGHPVSGGQRPDVAAASVTEQIVHLLARLEDSTETEVIDATARPRHGDRKALAKEQAKKISMGHKADDHEEGQQMG